jgi:hypothetical protein
VLDTPVKARIEERPNLDLAHGMNIIVYIHKERPR